MLRNTRISLIAAMDEKRGIGKGGKIPWHITEDFKRFKTFTMGHSIIMGRKTFESIGKPLPGRTNIIITTDKTYQAQGCIVVDSFEEAHRQADLHEGADEVFIIGGGQIFEQTIGLADKLYLTIIKGDFGCDTFFPNYAAFTKVVAKVEGESEGYQYTFLDLER